MLYLMPLLQLYNEALETGNFHLVIKKVAEIGMIVTVFLLTIPYSLRPDSMKTIMGWRQRWLLMVYVLAMVCSSIMRRMVVPG